MSSLRCPRLPFLLPRLPVPLRSLLGRVSTSVFYLLLCPAQPDFHVQLSDRCLTSAWESFFRRVYPASISKASGILLRSASFNSA